MLLIYNPTSGKGQIAPVLSQVLDIFTKAGWLVTVHPTQGRGDATRTAHRLGGCYDRVVCCGGDGTLSETVAGLMSVPCPPPLGYLPAGSTNDCASTLRLPRDLRQAAQVAATDGVLRPWDIGRLNGRPFVYVVAFGAFTSVAYDTPQELKNTFGHLAYIMGGVAAIPSITPYHLRVEYDGQVVEDDFFYGMVCNTISVGGVKALPTDRVELDDGLFEVVLVRRPANIADIYSSLQALIQRKPLEEGPILSFHAGRLSITGDKELPWTLDGEYGGRHQTVLVENCSRALRVIQGT